MFACGAPAVNEDGLLDPVDQSEEEWLKSSLFGSADRLEGAVHFVSDVIATRQIVWPAARDGRLVPPPPEHVLDALIRRSFNWGESPEWDAVWTLRPEASTVLFKMDLSSQCDVCRRRPARYDAYTERRRFAAWMCPWCFQRRSTLRLGIGEGQFVMRYCEISPDIWRRYGVARSVWQHRGAPLFDFDLTTYSVSEPTKLGPPYAFESGATSSTPVSRSFFAVLQEAGVRPDPSKGMFPEILSQERIGETYWARPNPIDNVTQNVVFPRGASEQLDTLVDHLTTKTEIRGRCLPSEVRLIAARQVARVLLEGLALEKAIGQLESTLRDRLGPTIVLMPLMGVEWEGAPSRLADHCLVGRLDVEFKRQLDEMADAFGVERLRLQGGPRWTESYEHLLEDPQSYEPAEAFHPVVLAQTVDSTAGVAVELAAQKARALFGAICAARVLSGSERWHGPPLAVSDHLPSGQGDNTAGCAIITLESGACHERDYGVRYIGDPVRLDQLVGVAPGQVIKAVALWTPTNVDSTDLATRIVACAKHFHAAIEARDVDFRALHVAAAMEALLVRPREEKRETLARRVACILVEPDAREAVGAEVKRLYDLRSDAAHVGLSSAALADRSAMVSIFVDRLPSLLGRAAEALAVGASHNDWLLEIDIDAQSLGS